MSHPMRGSAGVLAVAALLTGCAHTTNYPDPNGPRYEGRHAVTDPDPVFRIVTFNVKWGRRVDPTISLWSWDHIFTRGLPLPAPGRVGVVKDTRGASDHRPVWAELGVETRL